MNKSLSYLRDEFEKVKYEKLIPYNEEFKIFLSILNDRDSLMARISYYTNINMCFLLKMKIKDARVLKLPKNLKNDLSSYLKNRKDFNDFAFINAKGGPINHTHMTQAFRRASKPLGFRISLTDLVKFKVVEVQ